MEKKLNVSISINGNSIDGFSSFTLEQKFNEHHKFELRFDHDAMEAQGYGFHPQSGALTRSKKFMGKNITVEFGVDDNNRQTFVGKVTRVELSQSHGSRADLIISGYSPTILLERGPDLGSYLNKTLETIVNAAASDAPVNDLKMKVKPARTDVIDYIIQYRESDFEFINRLSAEYHEWFFYDGSNLNFGKPAKLKEVDLVFGRNLQNMQYSLQIAPLKYTKFSYNPDKDEVLTSDGKGEKMGNQDMQDAISASNEVYDKGYSQPIPIRVDSKKDIDDYVQNEQKAIISDLLRIIGTGDEPTLALGSVANISVSVNDESGFTTHGFEHFLVTSIFHHIDGIGHYYNTFEAVDDDTERLPVYNAYKPSPDIQIATVSDNDDPDKKSRIKVKFKWETKKNDPTEWLRIVTPSAGSDDQNGSNRGFIAIPEKNDQVLVAFEEGNIARPVVMGSVYHSNNGNSSAQQDNHLKSMSTRSGLVIQFDDSSETQGITIKDRNGNVILIDSQGNNITITALETMTFNAKSMKINVDQDMEMNVKQNMKINVQQKVDMKATDVAIDGNNSFAAKGESSAKIEGAQVEIKGTATAKVSGAQLDLEGSALANLKAALVQIN